MTTPATTPPRPPALILSSALDVLRGGIIGLAELLPGISGGTIALITGVYERLIAAASHVVAAIRRLIVGPGRRAGFVSELRRVEWRLVVPVVVGMAAAVVTLAGAVEGLVSANPELARGLFFGLVAASIAVPLRLAPAARSAGSRAGGATVFLFAAVVAFLAVDLAGSSPDVAPQLWLVFAAATIAVCALVVPGVSGSFFLLAIGLYSPTLRAVAERDLAYLGVFALGALVGLVTIVRVMKHLLDRHRRVTLIAMAGLMLGSLRALWPWQTTWADGHGVGALALPVEPVWGPIALALAGAAIVVALMVADAALQRRADTVLQRRVGAPAEASGARASSRSAGVQNGAA